MQPKESAAVKPAKTKPDVPGRNELVQLWINVHSESTEWLIPNSWMKLFVMTALIQWGLNEEGLDAILNHAGFNQPDSGGTKPRPEPGIHRVSGSGRDSLPAGDGGPWSKPSSRTQEGSIPAKVSHREKHDVERSVHGPLFDAERFLLE